MKISETAYLAKIEEVFQELKSSRSGLTDHEVQARLEKFGLNKIEGAKKITPLQIFLSQFKSPLVYILLIAGTITLILGEMMDAVVIWGAIFLDIIVGFIQEYRAGNALESLSKTVALKTTVRRNNKLRLIDAVNVVPGDILVLKMGDKVPVDARIFHSINLEADESTLTGESVPQEKDEFRLQSREQIGDRTNMLYMGTNVVSGNCEAIVVSTGEETELGKISEFVKEEKHEKTFLQEELDRLARNLGVILVSITVIIFILGLLRGTGLSQMFAEAVALAVAGLPASLPVAVTVIFAIGMQKILKKKGLVKKLLATETLGRTEVICFDKTGTLTKGKMHVIDLEFLDESIPIEKLLHYKDNSFVQNVITASAICNQAFVDQKEKYIGNPTDVALLKLARQFGLEKEQVIKELPLLDSQPFDPKMKFSVSLLDGKKENCMYVIGAPEILLKKSSHVVSFDKSKSVPLTNEYKKELQKRNEAFGAKGYRIIGCAIKDVSNKRTKIGKSVSNLTFVGLIVISDPLRGSSKDTVKKAIDAGVRLVMVTGDQPITAVNIAKQVGLPCEPCNVISGTELEKLSDVELDKRIEEFSVICRVAPADKVRIINSWKRKGKVVAMTGDGVNDAPALILADIGVALGSGTEVAKESADLVLLDDNLETILEAIREGRGILDNIKKVITYLLSDSFAEIGLVGVAILLGYPIPILPAQILWVNLVEDGLPDIALAMEPTEEDVIKICPSRYKRPILDKEVKTIVFVISWLDDIALLGLFFYLYNKGLEIEYIRTMVYSVLAMDSLFFAFSCKSLRKPIWRIDLFNNKLLNVSFVLGIVMLIGSIYIPLLQIVLKTVPLSLNDWGLIGLIGIIELVGIEVVKEIFIHSGYWKEKGK